MLTANGSSLVAYLRSQGYFGASLNSAIRRAFPDARTQSLNALLSYEQRTAAAARAGQRGASSTPITAPSGSGNADIAARIRYGIRVPIEIAGREQRPVWVYVPALGPLSRDQLLSEVNRLISSGRILTLGGSPEKLVGATISGPIQVSTVERGG